MPDEQFAALERISNYLREKKVDDQTIAFIVGRMIRVASEATMAAVAGSLDESEITKLISLSDEEKQTALKTVYESKTGKTVAQLREEITEKLVQDFEQA